jgi:hypothetical protein
MGSARLWRRTMPRRLLEGGVHRKSGTAPNKSCGATGQRSATDSPGASYFAVGSVREADRLILADVELANIDLTPTFEARCDRDGATLKLRQLEGGSRLRAQGLRG